MSVFTKQVRNFGENAGIYFFIFIGWFFFALLLTGLVGHAAAEPLHWYEVFFCFGVAAMALWCLYYAWLNAYLFLTRNKAGQKRDMLESAADLQYRPR